MNIDLSEEEADFLALLLQDARGYSPRVKLMFSDISWSMSDRSLGLAKSLLEKLPAVEKGYDKWSGFFCIHDPY